MESSILCALSGNNSVKRFSLRPSFAGRGKLGEEYIRALTQALATNEGIEHLDLSGFYMNVKEYRLLFRSLSTHPHIKFLSIGRHYRAHLAYSAKSIMMHTILQMLRLNTVIHTIEVPEGLRREAMYQNSILSRLEMNRSSFEVQRRAMKRADPSIRPQLLGRALHMVQYNPDLVFRFLSENVPAFVRTEEEVESVAPLEQDPVAGQKRKASS
jgi:hypothetical protein